jgi:lipase chaperone LimK
MSELILISDIYKLREEKQKELEFYRGKLEELQRKMFFIQKEVQLTNFIIDLIEKEKIQDIRALIDEKKDKK